MKRKHKGEYLYDCAKEGNKIKNKLCTYKTNGKEEFKVPCLTKHTPYVPEKHTHIQNVGRNTFQNYTSGSIYNMECVIL